MIAHKSRPSDTSLRDEWLKRLNSPPEELARIAIERLREQWARLGIDLAVWLNPNQDPWSNGIEILFLCNGFPVDPDADFRPKEFEPEDGLPRLWVILSSIEEIEMHLQRSSSQLPQEVKLGLSNGTMRVFSSSEFGASFLRRCVQK